jgi:nucleotide-binding universal stress UspA family protein
VSSTIDEFTPIEVPDAGFIEGRFRALITGMSALLMHRPNQPRNSGSSAKGPKCRGGGVVVDGCGFANPPPARCRDYARTSSANCGGDGTMSKHILVGYDPRTRDRAPIQFGAAAARFTGAPLVVASVHDGGGDAVIAAQMAEELVEDVSETLEEVRGELHAEGIEVQCRDLANTNAARALHEAAEAEDARLLVVGSTHRGSVGRVLPGSTAERLMHGAPCPIAVVPHGWHAGGGLHTIGVAYVDTEEGREALRGASALARRGEATLRVLTVAKVRASMYAETELHKDFEGVEGEHRVRAEAAARAAVADLDVPVEVDAFLEDPAESLISVSQNLDLLVCGSRGYGPVRAVMLGGVSRRVAAEAHCPVIILPRGVSASLESLTA